MLLYKNQSQIFHVGDQVQYYPAKYTNMNNNGSENIYNLGDKIEQVVNSQFCYMLVKDLSSGIVYAIYIVLLIALLRKLTKARHSKPNKIYTTSSQSRPSWISNPVHIYTVLLIWCIISIVEIICVELLYVAIRRRNYQFDISPFSKSVFGATFVGIFLFQAAVLMAIAHWIYCFINYVHNTLNGDTMASITSSTTSIIPQSRIQQQALQAQPQQQSLIPLTLPPPFDSTFQSHTISFLKVYSIIRLVILTIWIPIFCFVPTYSKTKQVSLLFLYFLIGQSILVFLLQIFAIVGMRKKMGKLGINCQCGLICKCGNQGRVLCKKFSIIIFPTFFRIIMILINMFGGELHADSYKCEIFHTVQFLPYGLKSLGGIGIYIFPFIALINSLTLTKNN